MGVRDATGAAGSTGAKAAAMKGDKVEIVIDAGGDTKTYEVTATRAGRRDAAAAVAAPDPWA